MEMQALLVFFFIAGVMQQVIGKNTHFRISVALKLYYLMLFWTNSWRLHLKQHFHHQVYTEQRSAGEKLMLHYIKVSKVILAGKEVSQNLGLKESGHLY